MPEKSPKPSESELDELIAEVEEATSPEGLFDEIDELCEEIDFGIEGAKKDVREWPEERKRREILETKNRLTVEELSKDKNWNVRILALCNSEVSSHVLRERAEKGTDYERKIIAHNPSTESGLLDRLFELTGEPEVIEAIRKHPNLSPVTKFKIENQ